MSEYSSSRTASRLHIKSRTVGYWSALFLTIALIVTGPYGAMMLMQTEADMQKLGLSTYIKYYDWLHMAPLAIGFLVAVAFLLLISSANYYAPREKRVFSLVAMGCAIIYAMVISINHIIQLVLVRQGVLVLQENAIHSLAPLAFFNPLSFFWALEVIGIGFQGLAVLFIAPAFSRTGLLSTWIHRCLIANGLISISATILAILQVGWLTQNSGYIGFIAWFITLIASTILMVIYFRPSRK